MQHDGDHDQVNHRLGGLGLSRIFATTNPIENMNGALRRTARNVKRWKDEAMIRRWVALGIAEAQKGFRRVTGYLQMPSLIAATGDPPMRIGMHPVTLVGPMTSGVIVLGIAGALGALAGCTSSIESTAAGYCSPSLGPLSATEAVNATDAQWCTGRCVEVQSNGMCPPFLQDGAPVSCPSPGN